MARNRVARWLESVEGEKWSEGRHRAAHAGESHLPNHIASVRHAPGEDPFWDKEPSGRSGIRDPRNDPAGARPQGPVMTARARAARAALGVILAVLAAWPWSPAWPAAARIILAAVYGLGAAAAALSPLWLRRQDRDGGTP